MQDNKNLPAVLQTAIISQKIDLNQVNFMLPTESFGQILGEYDKVVIEVVTINSNEKDGEVFKIGGKKALGKIPLQKIGNALGIIWDPVTTTVLESTERKSRAKATGAIKKPNGEYIIISEEKTIDLDVYEEEQVIVKIEEAAKGKIVDWEDKKPIRKPWGSEQEKQAWIDYEVKKAVLQRRKFKDELAMTGAKTRVIRALVAIKSAYTDAELSRPFAFPKVILDTNKLLSNPEARNATIDRMTGSINAVFGGQDLKNVTPKPAPLSSLTAPEETEDAETSEEPSFDRDFDDIPFGDEKSPKEKLDELSKDERVQGSKGMKAAIEKLLSLYEKGDAHEVDLVELYDRITKALADWENKKGGAA